jgi:HAD superfamily hydrolase (TIGR01509 family)
MTKNVKAILFDIDGTLFDRNLAQVKILQIIVDSLPEIFGALDIRRVRKAFSESDHLTTAEFDSGMPSEGLRDRRSRLFLRLLDLPESFTDKITEIYVRQLPAVDAPVAGAVRLVKALNRKYQLGAVSNGMPDVQYRKLENIGLRGFFSCVVLSEEVGFRKPDTSIFLEASRALNLQPAQCVYVGDTYATDVVGAKNSGMQACWFNRDGSLPPDGGSMADFVVKDLLEIPGVLKGMGKTRE